MSSTLISSMSLKDEGELLYTTLVGMVMAAIFAAGFHGNVEKTLANLASEGSSYPFPSFAVPSAAKFTTAITGFLLGVVLWTLIGAIRWSLVRKLLTYRDWLKHPRSKKTKAWALSLKLLMPRKKYLNSFQHVIPKYPLPKLSDTCRRALEVYEPLLTEAEFKQLKQDMKEFEKGEGPMLQALLEKRYQTEENWVSELWDNYAYLSQRTPIIVNTSIGTETGIKKSNLEMVDWVKPAGRAASVAYGYLSFWELIKTNKLPALLVMDLVPICATRYRYLLGCTRLPGLKMDELKLYEDSKHIIVIRKGVMYRIDVYCTTPSGKEIILPAEEIQRQLEIIIQDTADLKESAQNPALFTAQARAQWAEDREKLQLKKVNAASLKDVESAIFHIVMDETAPENLSEEAQQTICSEGFNLWCDKSASMRVFENSRCGLHFEHSTADATLFGRMFEFFWALSKFDKEGNAITPGNEPVFMPKQINSPQRLDWDLSQFQNVIPKYQEDLKKRCDDLDMIVLTVPHGKGAMKKCRVSPDSLFQMAIQLAYYRMHKSTPKTYESATTRFFKYGRTETIRPVSKASVTFTKVMDDPSTLQPEKIKHCKEAMLHQHNHKLEAMNGEACDRHIFGLYIAAKMTGVTPKIFQNKCLLEPDQLSTSQSPYIYDPKIAKRMSDFPTGGGFAPQRPDGYGICYLFLSDDAMTIHISSFRSCSETDSTRMGEELLKAIEDIKNLFKPNLKK